MPGKRRLYILLLLLLFSWAPAPVFGDVPGPESEKIAEENDDLTLSQRIDRTFTPFVDFLSGLLFWDPFSAAGIYDKQVYDGEGTP